MKDYKKVISKKGAEEKNSDKKSPTISSQAFLIMVARGRIELPTQGFSILIYEFY